MIEGMIYHTFTRTWIRPYQQVCHTCGRVFLSSTANKRYCSYACTKNKYQPIPKEDGVITIKLHYTCAGCLNDTVEVVTVPNTSTSIEGTYCRSCAGGQREKD